ncbi:MAG: FAD:protein FMN transferase, partial [Candidatus Coproplasma sp.]
MNKKIISCLCAAVCAVSAVGFSACNGAQTDNDGVTGRQATYYKFNTQAQLVAFDDFTDESRLNALYSLNEEVKTFLDGLEASLSTSVEGSCVYQFNQAAEGETVAVDKTTYEVLSIAKSVYELTDGYYNPAVYYCVDLYGFSPTANLTDYPRVSEGSKLPTQEYVEAFRELATYFAEIQISNDGGVYSVRKPEGASVT